MSNDNRHKTEELGCVELRGVYHAMYPTALSTLCLMDGGPYQLTKELPTCHACLRTVSRFARQVGEWDIPAGWRWHESWDHPERVWQ